jgi:hypothetical protein
MNLLGIGSIIDAVGKAADVLTTSDEERMKLALEEKRLNQAIDLAQIDVNKTEAASRSRWVAGWRPAVGWVCAASLAYVAIVEPAARFVATLAGWGGAFPAIDTSLTLQVLLGMLGFGGLRTFEKHKGLTR